MGRHVCPSTTVVREGLTQKVTQEQKLEGHQEQTWEGSPDSNSSRAAATLAKAHAWDTEKERGSQGAQGSRAVRVLSGS